MDEDQNVTYITLGGHVELHKYRYLYFIIMFTVYILIICFNSTIVCLIWIQKNLHEPMYIFIAALLMNSVLFSSALYPKLLIDFLSEEQIISYPGCLSQYVLFYSLCGSEFLLLAAMAYDRYVSICKPLQYHTIMTKTNIIITLVSAWLLPPSNMILTPALVAKRKLCDFTLKGIFCNNSVLKLQCVKSTVITVYGVVILFTFSIFPVFFIFFTYTNILRICYKSSSGVRKRAAETCLPHLLVLISLVCIISYDVIVVRLETNFPKTIHLVMSLQVIVYHPLFNPLIYGLNMREISKHLNRLFCQAVISVLCSLQ
ncbi:putative gustatory receptor clone PTE03 [Thalassophryne amazonica]|uniref:putative gustatory receptor clone PTE03 n=1 Tax=Thalassophryne amazonica TaxID=390379 RepID=UPI001471742E|nr:putative gustatory receptor clone PTE03 [Thalassophryne amazonica]